MENKSSSLLATPSKWSPRYILTRIGKKDIEIDRPTRDAILNSMQKDQKYVQVGEYTIMLRSISEISPKYGSGNIPPRPYYDPLRTPGYLREEIESEAREWDRYFGKIREDEIGPG